MVTEAKTTNYWISNSALYIQLNATGEPNRIQASVVSGASILCYMQGIDGLGYDAGHNYQRWTLAAYPSEFPSDERRYLYVAIPRPKKTDSSDGTIRQRNTDDVALVVFPSERIDIYGKSITDESKQVGSEDYYYIYLQGIISEVQITGDNVRYRDWVNAQPFDYGSLATDESLASGGIGQWWQYNSINDTITFLKTIAIATISSLTATTIKITKELFFGDHKISGVAKDNTSDTSDELIVTPNFLGQFGVRHFLSKTDDDTAHGLITFEKGIRFGVQKVADALNEVWDITEAGVAHLSQLLVKGNVQIGEIGKPVEANFGKYLAGSTGAQVAVKADGTSLAEFDYITIRRAADFRSITIHELRYIGGELAITPAAMQVSKVERLGKDGNVVADDVEPDKFKCYFDTSDSKGEKKVYNEFVVGDQARCQQFGIDVGTHEFVKTKYYWRLVVEVGENYIVLSNTDKDKLTTSEPSVNDNIVQLGYRYEGQDNRQAAIILSATANDAPSQKFYQGINDYSLDHVVKDEGYDAATGLFHCNIYGDSYTGDKEGTSFFQYDSKKKEATFKGKMIFNSESKLPDGSSVNDIAKKDDLKDLNIKSGNLLRNTSFCGDYESIDISEDTEISEDKETFSEKLKYWTMENTRVVDTEDSTSGKAVQIGGTLSQQLAQPLLPGKDYVLSFKGKGTTVRVSVGGETQDITMTSSFDRYELHITCSDAANGVFSMVSTNCVVCEIMLSYGKLAPAWSPSYSDNDKSMAEFQNMKFLTDAITQGSTTIDGGLVMSQQFKVGNFRDKKMIKETGGMSGYYNDDDSPFLWGGGTLEQAIYTIQKYKDNPNYEPTAEELNNLAKFVVTHGGRAILTDIILRGIIYAEGGVMKSIKSPNGNFEIDEEGNAKLKGHIEAGDGKIGGFFINRDSLFHGDTSKWATTQKDNISQIGWNFIRIAQAITYLNSTIAYQKIGIGGNANPNDKEDSGSIGSTALYIYRKMLAYTQEKAYKPAAIIESRNVQNRDIALRLIGGLQVYGGIIQHGRVMTYTKEGDTDILDLSFGTIFTLRNASADSMDFFFPSLPEARNQLGVTNVDEEFCIPVMVVAAAGTTKFAISTQLAAQDTTCTEADGGRFVDNNGTWDYGNDKHYGGNRIAMENGDSWSFSLTFTKAQGYYIQILNRQV